MRNSKEILRDIKNALVKNRCVTYKSEIFNDKNIEIISELIQRLHDETHIIVSNENDIDVDRLVMDDFDFTVYKTLINKENLSEEISKIPQHSIIVVLEYLGEDVIKEMMKESIKLGRNHSYVYIGLKLLVDEIGYKRKELPEFIRKRKIQEVVETYHHLRGVFLFVNEVSK